MLVGFLIITILVFLVILLRRRVLGYMEKIIAMPVMKWIPFGEIRYHYFDNSGFWTMMILLSLMRGQVVEAQLMEGFSGIERPTYKDFHFNSSEMEIYEFRLTYRPRRKKKIKLRPLDWFERDPVVQPT